MYPHTKGRTPSSPSPLPPKRPPRAMNRSLEQVCRAPSSLSQIQKLAFWRPTTVNGRHSKKNRHFNEELFMLYYWRMCVLAYVRIILSFKPVFGYSPQF